MKILFKQPDGEASLFDGLGIKQCFCKYLSVASDSRYITNKAHHHTGFELHIIERGHQIYSTDGETFGIGEGEFLLIPPGTSHRVLESAPNTHKVSLSFSTDGKSAADSVNRCTVGNISDRVKDNLRRVAVEKEKRLFSSFSLISACVFEMIVLVLRDCGMKESTCCTAEQGEDSRLVLATQYVKDNVEQPLSVAEVAAYCHLSEKQLTRIFASEGTTPAEYIRAQKVKRIEDLLENTFLPLKAISDRMNFSSEYYFNSFFKKYSGMTPGEYRKMK